MKFILFSLFQTAFRARTRKCIINCLKNKAIILFAYSIVKKNIVNEWQSRSSLPKLLFWSFQGFSIILPKILEVIYSLRTWEFFWFPFQSYL